MLNHIFSLAVAAMVSAALLPSAAQARWRVAESEHFVVYADDSERDLQRFGEMLERYHEGMEIATGLRMATPSPSNRLTVYAVGSQRDISRLYGDGGRFVGGFYQPCAGGSVAMVQDVRPNTRQLDQSMLILLHEYAHHFFHVTSNFTQPGWMSEGGAEFFASAGFPSDGGLELGRPAFHRGAELIYGDDIPIRELLDYNNLAREDDRDSFYGRSWLLYHFLKMEDARKGQLERYMQALASGTPTLTAAAQAFGDLDQLQKDVDAYQRKRKIFYYTIAAEHLQPSPVRVRDLSEGMQAVMPLLIQSKRGVNREQALALLPEIRAVAAAHPGDAGVLSALAEAEYDAGYNAEAIAAADRAIAIDPAQANAYVQKGYAMFRAAEGSGDKAAYDAAMAPFSALNTIEHDHPLPLIYFYRSFTERGAEPPELARHALERALLLSPFDINLRMQVVHMLAQEGKIGLSQVMLKPLLANPHDQGLVEVARQMDRQLEGGAEGEPLTFQVIAAPTLVVPPGDD